MKIVLFFCLYLPFLCFGIPDANYAVVLKEKVVPHFQSMTTGTLINESGLTLRYRTLIKSGATKSLVILPGRAEPAAKYAEIIYDLDQADLNIFILDHQGQGESDRLISDRQKGFVRDFDDYVRDLDLFMQTIVLPTAEGSELLLLAHSMGGAIGVRYLSQHPGNFKRKARHDPGPGCGRGRNQVPRRI